MIQKKIPLAKIVFRAMIVVILLLLLVSFIYPLFWMIISALKTNTEIFTTSYQLPKIPQWKNFVKVWNVGVKDYFLNSIIMTNYRNFRIRCICSLPLSFPRAACNPYVYSRRFNACPASRSHSKLSDHAGTAPLRYLYRNDSSLYCIPYSIHHLLYVDLFLYTTVRGRRGCMHRWMQ